MLEESSSRTRRAFIWVATGLAMLVVATCFAASDSVLAGAVAATRYSANFSGLVAAVALVARDPRPIAFSRRRTEWTMAFVAAHGVHFATVVLRALLEPDSKLRSFAIDVMRRRRGLQPDRGDRRHRARHLPGRKTSERRRLLHRLDGARPRVRLPRSHLARFRDGPRCSDRGDDLAHRFQAHGRPLFAGDLGGPRREGIRVHPAWKTVTVLWPG